MRKLSMEELNRKSADEFRQADKIPIVLILENIRSGYNVGSLFRTADAFLLQAIYICGYTAFPPHKEIKKTALGAEETVEWKKFHHTKEAVEQLRMEGFTIYAVEQASKSILLHKLNFHQGKAALIFGNEVTGVEQSSIEMADGSIEVPQLGMKHSLNVTVAAGIVLWEMVRKSIADQLPVTDD